MTDRDEIRALAAGAPVGALVVVIVGWALGGIAGGWGTAGLSARATLRHGLVLGGAGFCQGLGGSCPDRDRTRSPRGPGSFEICPTIAMNPGQGGGGG